MSKVNNNMWTKGNSGMAGKQMVFRERDGVTMVAKAPGARSGNSSTSQDAVRSRFKAAARYAKAAILDPVRKAAYDAVRKPLQTAYNVAFRDAFTAPVVSQVEISGYTGKVGDTINVHASDDFKLVRIHVAIADATGNIVEEGEAVFTPVTAMIMDLEGEKWVYTATKVLNPIAGATITATAYDLPENQTSLTVNL